MLWVPLRRGARRLVGLERRKARQLSWAKRHNGGRYSKRLRKTIHAIAALRARQSPRRSDFTHKLTSDLAKNHGYVGTEDLSVKNMTASAKGTVEQPGTNVRAKAGLNRGILDNAPGERRRQLDYKCPRYGSDHRPVPAAATSQTCCEVRDEGSRQQADGSSPASTAGTRGMPTSWLPPTSNEEHKAQGPSGGLSPRQRNTAAAGPAENSTGRRKPSQSREAEGASVKRVAPAPTGAGRGASGVA